jgi:uncharacterized protein YjbI with pentapeptide repeats
VAQPQERQRHRRNRNQEPVKAKSQTGPDIAAKLSADADDPDEVRKALDEAAGMSRNLWLVFLTFGTYLAIAVSSVTYRDLFLENPIKLPLLNVDLPLLAFFWVAPLLFLIFHAYLLLNLRLLVDNVRRYNEMVDAAKLERKQDDSFRLLLTNFPFVQLLAGTSDSRRGLVGWVLRAIVWITVVLAPVLLLLLMQLQFLPYHHHWVAWVQRTTIVADLILLWLFWPGIMLAGNRGRVRVLVSRASGAILTALVVIFSMLIATFPGEFHDQNIVATAVWVPTALDIAASRDEDVAAERGGRVQALLGPKSIYELLFLGNANEVTGSRESFWSNTLVLPDQDFVDDEQLDKVERTISLRGRDLRKAVLVRGDLRKADFTGANLDDADLSLARLDQAKFGCAKAGKESFDIPFDFFRGSYQWPTDGCSWMLRAHFDGASLKSANMQSARLQESSFERAQLQDTNLYGARLQGAVFKDARLQGALLAQAWLQGASFDSAQLQGAWLDHAWMQGASLYGSNLDGATLVYVWLHGASLAGVSARGASFYEAHLQGANLTNVKLDGASLMRALMWRANMSATDEMEGANKYTLSGSDFRRARLSPLAQQNYGSKVESFNVDVFQSIQSNALRGVLTEAIAGKILNKLSVLNPRSADPPFWHDSRRIFLRAKVASYMDGYSLRSLDQTLVEIICESDRASSVLRGMLRNGRLKSTSFAVRSALKAGDERGKCPGAKSLSEADWQTQALAVTVVPPEHLFFRR